MGHADDDLPHAPIGSIFHNVVQDRKKRLGTFQRKPLLTDILGLQELLEQLREVQLQEGAQFLPPLQPRFIASRLHALLKPYANAGVLNVHVFDADGPAVRFLQGGQELTERGPLQADKRASVERLVEVAFAKAELGQLQQRMRWLGVAKRIEACDQVAKAAVDIDKANDPDLGMAIHRDGSRGRTSLPQLEALEEEPPSIVHGRRVIAPGADTGRRSGRCSSGWRRTRQT